MLLRPYGAFNRTPYEIVQNGKAHAFALTLRDGSQYAMVLYDKSEHALSVWLASQFAQDDDTPLQPTPRQQPTQAPIVQPTSTPDENDCMVYATELLNRVRPNSVWSTILSFSVTADGKLTPLGHAMTVWKVAWDNRVLAGDKSGTFELKTTSTDITNVLTNLANSYAAKFHQQYTLAGHYIDSPSVNGIGNSQSLLAQQEPSRLAGLLIGTLFWLVAVVVCFLKGKRRVAIASIAANVIGGFAVAGQWQTQGAWSVAALAFNIAVYTCAIRLPYPWSYWAWRFYYIKPDKPSAIWKKAKMIRRWWPDLARQAAAQPKPQADEPIEAEWQKV